MCYLTNERDPIINFYQLVFKFIPNPPLNLSITFLFIVFMPENIPERAGNVEQVMNAMNQGELGQSIYQTQEDQFNVIQHLLQTPDIPLDLRNQFYQLWNNVIFGNFEDKDIKFLMSKFREWTILLKWEIPEQHWGNRLSFEDEDGRQLSMDLNRLINMLEQLFFINCTRGKEGFTTKELNTRRIQTRGRYEAGENKSKTSLF